MAITIIVLAGGRSRRLGRDKALEPLLGAPLLQRVVEMVSPLSDDTLVITAPGAGERSLSPRPGLRWLVDIYPGKGSLGGIYTGLYHAAHFHSLVVACDMPFLHPGLLRYLAELAPGYDVVIPLVAGQYEPLHAIYSRSCLEPIKPLLDEGNHRIIDFFSQVRVRPVPEAELVRFDPQHLSFFNINTQEDLDRARQLAPSLEA